MSSVPQTVWELQRFKVWIVISVCFLHPCSYFLPTPRKLFFDQNSCIRGQNWQWLFSISEYLNIFDASTLRNGFLKPKMSILGGWRCGKMPQPWKFAYFFSTLSYILAYNSGLRHHRFAKLVGNESWDQGHSNKLNWSSKKLVFNYLEAKMW